MNLAKKKKILAACGSYAGVSVKKSSLPWSPTDVSGCLIWWDGDYTSNIIDINISDTFAEIKDRSVNNNHLSQAIKVNQPDVVLVGARKFWQTDGIAKFMTATYQAVFSTLNAYTIIQVLDCTTITNSPVTVSNNTHDNEWHHFIGRVDSATYNNSIQLLHRSQSVAGWYNNLYGNTDLQNRKFVAVARCTGSVYNARIDGLAEWLNVFSGANDGKSFDDTILLQDKLNAGKTDRPTTAYNKSKCGDYLAFSRDLTDTECGLIEDYLKSKHGIS